MREHGILFSPPMVRAILADAKTVTRRVVEPRPVAPRGIYDAPGADTVVEPYRAEGYEPKLYSFNWKMTRLGGIAAPFSDGTTSVWKCPYGDPGDLLWVREAWSISDAATKAWETTPVAEVVYSSTSEVPAGWRRRHARFMPRCYARLLLEVTDVRVERLCSLDDADAIREGIPAEGDVRPFARFAALWDSINGDAPWSSDPWVWRIEFKVVEAHRG